MKKLDEELAAIREKAIDSTMHTKPQTWKDLNGRVILRLEGFEMAAVEMIRTKPADIRINIMRLTEEEMLKHIEEIRSSKIKVVRQLLKGNYVWTADGEPIFLLDDMIEGVPYDHTALILKAKRNNLKPDQVNAIIEFYTGPYSEVKNNNDD